MNGQPSSPILTLRRALVVLAAAALVVVFVVGTHVSAALFTDSVPNGGAVFGTKALFPGERVTPAFTVEDASSGSATDRSAPLSYPSDGRTQTTSNWSSAFAAGRYVEFDLNASLPTGVAVSSGSLRVRLASAGPGTACYYIEVRRISTGAVLGTHGSSGSPAACVTGTTQNLTTISVPEVATTNLADDVRIRLYGRESNGVGMVVDEITVSGTTTYQSFTIYPILTRDLADTTIEITPWQLVAP